MSYTPQMPWNTMTFSPWFDAEFQERIRDITPFTRVSADRLYVLDILSRFSFRLPGSFIECGVYKGGSACVIGRNAGDKVLHLFDTFEGMPENDDPAKHGKGDFGDVVYEDIRKLVSANAKNAVWHKGIMPASFQGVFADIAFAHVDVDLYSTAMACCEFIYPRLVSGGCIVFDDYGFERYKNSEKKAVDEYFASKQERLWSLSTGQCVLLKL